MLIKKPDSVFCDCRLRPSTQRCHFQTGSRIGQSSAAVNNSAISRSELGTLSFVEPYLLDLMFSTALESN